MLCMYMVYVQYVWVECYCIHLSVRPSIRPCMCPLSLKRCIQCMYNMYVPRYYTIHVYYVHTLCMVFILYIHPSVWSVHPSMHVCFVCILCMDTVYVSRYYTVYLCCICIWFMYTMYGMYTIVSICPSACPSIHACILLVYTLYDIESIYRKYTCMDRRANRWTNGYNSIHTIHIAHTPYTYTTYIHS